MLNESDTSNTQTDTSSPAPPGNDASKKPKKLRILKKPQRELSSISFPYQDLESGLTVMQAIHRSGGVGVTREQLAGFLNMSPISGGFLIKVSAARLFGLVTFSQGKFEVTSLGYAAMDNDDRKQRQARAEAFLNVPLFRKAYEEFRGKPLPPRPHGLEQAFMKFGVSQKQKETARQVFERSARQAGYFNAGEDRLIPPIVGPSPSAIGPAGRTASAEIPEDSVVSQPAKTKTYHPFIEGLLESLPEPGTNWAIEGRAKWLQAAALNFDLMYKGSGEIRVTAAPSQVTSAEPAREIKGTRPTGPERVRQPNDEAG